MRRNWIEFACLLLTDLEGKNQDSFVELGLLANYRFLSMGYGSDLSTNPVRSFSIRSFVGERVQ